MMLDRVLYLGPDITDCAQPDACVVQAFSLNEGYVAAEAAIQFDPAVPLPPPPSITIDPATGVVDGQLITVTGENFPRRNSTNVLQCRTGAVGLQGCDFTTIGYALVNPDGTFTFALRVKRYIDVDSGRVDCAVVGACMIGAGSLPHGNPSTNTPILFTTNPPSTPPAKPVEVAPAFTG